MAQEKLRGCGFRKVGGVYLVGAGLQIACDRLPIPLEVCPTCGEGLKFSRNPRQIDAYKMFGDHIFWKPETHDYCPEDYCYVCRPPSDVSSYIMGVGERHYTPESFIKEAMEMGVSKRISAIPRNLVVGKSVVFLSHKKAIVHKTMKCPKCKSDKVVSCPGSINKEPLADINYICQGCLLEFEIPLSEETYQHGIFYALKPQRIEKIYWTTEDTPELREKCEKQGVAPVFLMPDKDHKPTKKGKGEDEEVEHLIEQIIPVTEDELKALVLPENVINQEPIVVCTSEWSHLVGVKNSKGVVLTEAMLQAWESNPKRELECIFCGTLYDLDAKFCSRCKEYKGLQPYVEGWSD